MASRMRAIRRTRASGFTAPGGDEVRSPQIGFAGAGRVVDSPALVSSGLPDGLRLRSGNISGRFRGCSSTDPLARPQGFIPELVPEIHSRIRSGFV
jgi:hypothetical protein